MIPNWVPAGAWAGLRIGARVFTNWTVIAILSVPVVLTIALVWRLTNSVSRRRSLIA